MVVWVGEAEVGSARWLFFTGRVSGSLSAVECFWLQNFQVYMANLWVALLQKEEKTQLQGNVRHDFAVQTDFRNIS